MIDENFYLSLPDDPEEAFPAYEKHVCDITFPDGRDSNDDSERRRYVSLILAYLRRNNMKLEMDNQDLPLDPEFFYEYYSQFRIRVGEVSARFHLEALSRKKAGISAIYVLSAPLKSEIHHYLTLIRNLIAEADISHLKRETLSKKLNAFAEEVDRDRTRLEALASAWIWTKREIKDGVEVLNPVLDKLEKIVDKFTKATELADALPSPKRGGEIEAPRKQIEHSVQRTDGNYEEFDDEIPF
jgi:hypothetical protein